MVNNQHAEMQKTENGKTRKVDKLMKFLKDIGLFEYVGVPWR